MTEREVPAFLQIASVVVSYGVAAIDERHATGANHFADATAHDERRVLVDPESKQLGVLANDHEQPLQAPALREVRVDDRRVTKQAEPGPDVLRDDVAFLVDLAAGHRQLGERSRAGARAAD